MFNWNGESILFAIDSIPLFCGEWCFDVHCSLHYHHQRDWNFIKCCYLTIWNLIFNSFIRNIPSCLFVCMWIFLFLFTNLRYIKVWIERKLWKSWRKWNNIPYPSYNNDWTRRSINENKENSLQLNFFLLIIIILFIHSNPKSLSHICSSSNITWKSYYLFF